MKRHVLLMLIAAAALAAPAALADPGHGRGNGQGHADGGVPVADNGGKDEHGNPHDAAPTEPAPDQASSEDIPGHQADAPGHGADSPGRKADAPGKPEGHGVSEQHRGNGQAHGRSKARPLCKPGVSYVLRGTVVAVGTGSIDIHVLSGNAHAHVFAGQDVTVMVGPDAKVRRDGPAAAPALAVGDRILVQVRGCKSEGASVALVAVRVDAHPTVPADDPAADGSTTSTTTEQP